ncbi:class I SAM-dependent methyltransferase [Vibrio methylphosphonaticus]|uniref:class I SAM-dependent methyltransferase n=1 Tax=Vibrio methylphosphonaticus TaxID=2946866 RepID=UPI00202AA213|nr:class I SAM-dependent methyltransferase [Vibrio methylphosphonaticus]MCL9776680.1 class I SAM-dependent methyltransferase [Vibrio methylphosphonaticus]
MGKMYTEFAAEYDEAIQNNAYNALYERPTTLALIGDVNGRTVLDLGCGPGVYAKIFTELGATVTAVDVSDEMVSITKSKLQKTGAAYAQDLSLGLPKECDGSFDGVVCPLMIHYLQDLTLLFSDISRVLKSGGVFVFSTHHPMIDFDPSDKSSNYFAVEKITEEWDTTGELVEVSFFRRSLTSIFSTLSECGFAMERFSEGTPDVKMKSIAPDTYERLSRRPNFVFIRARKTA